MPTNPPPTDPPPYTPWPAAEYLPHLERLAATMTTALADADLDAPVLACAPWTVRDVARHVTFVHAWAAGAVAEGHPDTPEGPLPETSADAAAGYRASADRLLGVLRAADPDAPAWGFGPKPRTVAFWLRRQPHEVAMHLVDVLAAQGLDAAPDPRLAADGVDEVVTLFLPRQVRLGRIPPLERSLAVVVEETGDRWTLAGDGTAAPAQADATLTGPADVVLRLLWGRTTLDAAPVRLDGDEAAARAVLAGGIVP